MAKISNVWEMKYRPKKVEDMALTEELKKQLQKMVDDKRVPSNLLLIGPAGTGKTTVARMLAKTISPNSYLFINASDTNGVDTIRNEIQQYVRSASLFKEQKIVVLDEADGLSGLSGSGSSAQQALRNLMEDYLDTCVFILTCNYESKIITPLISRCLDIRLTASTKDVAKYLVKILKNEDILVDKDAKTMLTRIIKKHYPDIRKIVKITQQSIKDGALPLINIVSDDTFVDRIASALPEDDLFDIRQEIIKNEDKFDGDYHVLLRRFFDYFVEKKDALALMCVVNAMDRHNVVMDHEVNFTGFLFNLKQTLKQK